MTRPDLLKRLNLDEEDFSNLVLKFRVFYASLNENEAAVVNRLLPNFKRVVGIFGGDITRDELKTLLAPPPPAPAAPSPGDGGQIPAGGASGAFGQNGLNQITNGDGNDG
jgi:hypothetical protein